MAKKEKGILNKTYENAKNALETGNRDLARDYFDFGIMHVADKRYNGNLKVDDKIENVKVGVWLERFWYGLENNNLLL
jgi:diketogulonate reductase-like aldo/keto reductase